MSFTDDDGNIVFNLGGQSSGFDPIPDGVYKVKVDSVNAKMSKNGNPYLEFVYVISEEGDYNGRKVWDNLTIIPTTAWKQQIVLETLTRQPWRENEMKLNPKDLVGLECRAVIYQNEYEGKVRNKVEKILPVLSDEAAGSSGGGFGGTFTEF